MRCEGVQRSFHNTEREPGYIHTGMDPFELTCTYNNDVKFNMEVS